MLLLNYQVCQEIQFYYMNCTLLIYPNKKRFEEKESKDVESVYLG